MEKIDKKEAGISALKGAIGAIPVAGTLLNEIIFDYRSRVKEKRLLLFLDDLSKTLRSLNDQKIDIDYLKTEEFSDILEEILKRVASSQSNEKRNRFKKILIGEMSASLKSEFKTSFLDITSNITETQLLILKEHNTIGKSVGRYYRDIENLNYQIPELEKSLRNETLLAKKGYANNTTLFEKRLKQIRTELNKKTKATKQSDAKRFGKYYGIDQEDYLIHVQDLVSKGLMIDVGIGVSGYNSFQILEITAFGKEYLKYIME
jgi:hypothetical protein